jgi:O-antigen/teichoic acid export membrane protein
MANTLDYQTPEPATEGGSWISRGGWALLDQALFSASNWLVQILLARWLVDEQAYGAFSVAFTFFLFVGTFHTSLLVEPLLVFGPQRFAGRLGPYLGVLTAGNFAIAAVGGVFLTVTGMIYWSTHHPHVAVACWSLAGASPFVFFLWLMRRACYVRLSPRIAAIAGVGYMAAMVGGLVVVNRVTGGMSVPGAMAVMGVSSLGAGLWLAWKEHVRWPGSENPITREVAAEHLRYGRWAAASGVVMFIPGQVYYLLLPLFVDVTSSGILRAMGNLYMPIIMANAALVGLILPSLVRTRGTPRFNKVLRIALLTLAGGPAVIWLVVGLLNYELMHLLYAGRFDDRSYLLWVLGLQPVLLGITNVYNAVLNASHRPDRVFFASLCSSVVALTIGIWLTAAYELRGVCASLVISSGVNALLASLFVRRLKEKAADDAGPAEPVKAHAA